MMSREHHRRRNPESSDRRREERRDSRGKEISSSIPSSVPHYQESFPPYQQSHQMSPQDSYRKPNQELSRELNQPESSVARGRHRTLSGYYSSSSSSFSSSTSSSLLNISRPAKFGISSFFSRGTTKKSHRVKKKRSGFLRFGSSSSSSVSSDLAYGRGYIDRRKSRDSSLSSGGKPPRRTGKSGRPRPPKHAQTDEEIIELGRRFAELARRQNDEDLRAAGKTRPSTFSAASTALRKFRSTNNGRLNKGVVNSKPHRDSSSDDSDWESTSSSDESSEDDVDSGLAYGSSYSFPSSLERPSYSETSIRSVQTNSRAVPLEPKPSVVDPKLFGPINSLRGIVQTPCGFGRVDPNASSNARPPYQTRDAPSETAASAEGRLQYVDPTPIPEPSRVDARRGSNFHAHQDLIPRSRPETVPLQQPKPIAPVHANVIESVEAGPKSTKTISLDRTEVQKSGVGLPGTAVGPALSSDAAIGEILRNAVSDHNKRQEARADDRKSQVSRSVDKGYDVKYEKSDSRYISRDIRFENFDEQEAAATRVDEREKPRRVERKSDRGADTERKSRRDKYYDDLHRTEIVQRHENDLTGDQSIGREEAVIEERRGDQHVTYGSRNDMPVLSEASLSQQSKSKIDPFQYQVANDAFQTPQFGSPIRPLTPVIIPVDREPDFSKLESYEPSSPSETYKQKLPDAHKAYTTVTQSTASMGKKTSVAANVVEAVPHENFHEGDASFHKRSQHQSLSPPPRDPILDEADHAYREARLVLKLQEQEERSKSNSQNRSVVDKWKDGKDSEDLYRLTSPSAKDHAKEKSPYDGPNADVRIDNVLESPREISRFRFSETQRRSLTFPVLSARDPSAERERPFLNLVRPTPAPSPTIEKQQSKEIHMSPHETRNDADSASLVIRKGAASTSLTQTPRVVSWGENQTKHYVVESPERDDDRNSETETASYIVEAPRGRTRKRRDWSAAAAAIAEAGIVVAASSTSDSAVDLDADLKLAESKDREQSPKKKPSLQFDDTVYAVPPIPGPKPARLRSTQTSGAFSEDLDFMATIAAGLEGSGFDPNIVIDDTRFHHRDSPPGSNEPLGSITAETIQSSEHQYQNSGEKEVTVGEFQETETKEQGTAPNISKTLSKLSEKEGIKEEEVTKDDIKDTLPRVLDTILEEDYSDVHFESTSMQQEKQGAAIGNEYRRYNQAARGSSPVKQEPRSAAEDIAKSSFQKRESRDAIIIQEDSLQRSQPKRFEKPALTGLADTISAVHEDERSAPSRDKNEKIKDAKTGYIADESLQVATPTSELSRESSYHFVEAETDLPPVVEWDLQRENKKEKEQMSTATDDLTPTGIPRPLGFREEQRIGDTVSRLVTGRPAVDDGNAPKQLQEQSPVENPPSRYATPINDIETSPEIIDKPFENLRGEQVLATEEEWEDLPRSKKKKKRSRRGTVTSRKSSLSSVSKNAPRPEIYVGSSGGIPKEALSAELPSSSSSDHELEKDSVIKGGMNISVPSQSVKDHDSSEEYKSPERKGEEPSRSKDEKGGGSSNLFNRFKSTISFSNKKQQSRAANKSSVSFLDNAGALGAGAGLTSAVSGLTQQKSLEIATGVVPQVEPGQETKSTEHLLSPPPPIESTELEIVERRVRPAIDPAYGDLLLLPPSRSDTPVAPLDENIPPLPESRSETPEDERVRLSLSQKSPHARRRSDTELKLKTPSPGAIPIWFQLGRANSSAAPSAVKSSPSGSPITDSPEIASPSRPRSRPMSWESTKDFQPLLLVEKTSREPIPTPISLEETPQPSEVPEEAHVQSHETPIRAPEPQDDLRRDLVLEESIAQASESPQLPLLKPGEEPQSSESYHDPVHPVSKNGIPHLTHFRAAQGSKDVETSESLPLTSVTAGTVSPPSGLKDEMPVDIADDDIAKQSPAGVAAETLVTSAVVDNDVHLHDTPADFQHDIVSNAETLSKKTELVDITDDNSSSVKDAGPFEPIVASKSPETKPLEEASTVVEAFLELNDLRGTEAPDISSPVDIKEADSRSVKPSKKDKKGKKKAQNRGSATDDTKPVEPPLPTKDKGTKLTRSYADVVFGHESEDGDTDTSVRAHVSAPIETPLEAPAVEAPAVEAPVVEPPAEQPPPPTKDKGTQALRSYADVVFGHESEDGDTDTSIRAHVSAPIETPLEAPAVEAPVVEPPAEQPPPPTKDKGAQALRSYADVVFGHETEGTDSDRLVDGHITAPVGASVTAPLEAPAVEPPLPIKDKSSKVPRSYADVVFEQETKKTDSGPPVDVHVSVPVEAPLEAPTVEPSLSTKDKSVKAPRSYADIVFGHETDAPVDAHVPNLVDAPLGPPAIEPSLSTRDKRVKAPRSYADAVFGHETDKPFDAHVPVSIEAPLEVPAVEPSLPMKDKGVEVPRSYADVVFGHETDAPVDAHVPNLVESPLGPPAAESPLPIKEKGVKLPKTYADVVFGHEADKNDTDTSVDAHISVPVEISLEAPAVGRVKTPVKAPIQSRDETPDETRARALIEAPVESPANGMAQPPLKAPVEVPVEGSVEDPVKTPVETPAEASIEAPVEGPLEGLTETPVKAPIEVLVQDVAETPVKSPIEASIDGPVQTSAKVPIEAPIEPPVEGPVEDSVEVFVQDVAETPVKAPVEASVDGPVQAPVLTPIETLDKAPVQASIELPVEAVVEVTVEDPVEAWVKGPAKTPVETPVKDSVEASVETPVQVPVEAPVETPVKPPSGPPTEASAPELPEITKKIKMEKTESQALQPEADSQPSLTAHDSNLEETTLLATNEKCVPTEDTASTHEEMALEHEKPPANFKDTTSQTIPVPEIFDTSAITKKDIEQEVQQKTETPLAKAPDEMGSITEAASLEQLPTTSADILLDVAALELTPTLQSDEHEDKSMSASDVPLSHSDIVESALTEVELGSEQTNLDTHESKYPLPTKPTEGDLDLYEVVPVHMAQSPAPGDINESQLKPGTLGLDSQRESEPINAPTVPITERASEETRAISTQQLEAVESMGTLVDTVSDTQISPLDQLSSTEPNNAADQPEEPQGEKKDKENEEGQQGTSDLSDIQETAVTLPILEEVQEWFMEEGSSASTQVDVLPVIDDSSEQTEPAPPSVGSVFPDTADSSKQYENYEKGKNNTREMDTSHAEAAKSPHLKVTATFGDQQAKSERSAATSQTEPHMTDTSPDSAALETQGKETHQGQDLDSQTETVYPSRVKAETRVTDRNTDASRQELDLSSPSLIEAGLPLESEIHEVKPEAQPVSRQGESEKHKKKGLSGTDTDNGNSLLETTNSSAQQDTTVGLQLTDPWIHPGADNTDCDALAQVDDTIDVLSSPAAHGPKQVQDHEEDTISMPKSAKKPRKSRKKKRSSVQIATDNAAEVAMPESTTEPGGILLGTTDETVMVAEPKVLPSKASDNLDHVRPADASQGLLESRPVDVDPATIALPADEDPSIYLPQDDLIRQAPVSIEKEIVYSPPEQQDHEVAADAAQHLDQQAQADIGTPVHLQPRCDDMDDNNNVAQPAVAMESDITSETPVKVDESMPPNPQLSAEPTLVSEELIPAALQEESCLLNREERKDEEKRNEASQNDETTSDSSAIATADDQGAPMKQNIEDASETISGKTGVELNKPVEIELSTAVEEPVPGDTTTENASDKIKDDSGASKVVLTPPSNVPTRSTSHSGVTDQEKPDEISNLILDEGPRSVEESDIPKLPVEEQESRSEEPPVTSISISNDENQLSREHQETGVSTVAWPETASVPLFESATDDLVTDMPAMLVTTELEQPIETTASKEPPSESTVSSKSKQDAQLTDQSDNMQNSGTRHASDVRAPAIMIEKVGGDPISAHHAELHAQQTGSPHSEINPDSISPEISISPEAPVDIEKSLDSSEPQSDQRAVEGKAESANIESFDTTMDENIRVSLDKPSAPEPAEETGKPSPAVPSSEDTERIISAPPDEPRVIGVADSSPAKAAKRDRKRKKKRTGLLNEETPSETHPESSQAGSDLVDKFDTRSPMKRGSFLATSPSVDVLPNAEEASKTETTPNTEEVSGLVQAAGHKEGQKTTQADLREEVPLEPHSETTQTVSEGPQEIESHFPLKLEGFPDDDLTEAEDIPQADNLSTSPKQNKEDQGEKRKRQAPGPEEDPIDDNKTLVESVSFEAEQPEVVANAAVPAPEEKDVTIENIAHADALPKDEMSPSDENAPQGEMIHQGEDAPTTDDTDHKYDANGEADTRDKGEIHGESAPRGWSLYSWAADWVSGGWNSERTTPPEDTKTEQTEEVEETISAESRLRLWAIRSVDDTPVGSDAASDASMSVHEFTNDDSNIEFPPAKEKKDRENGKEKQTEPTEEALIEETLLKAGLRLGGPEASTQEDTIQENLALETPLPKDSYEQALPQGDISREASPQVKPSQRLRQELPPEELLELDISQENLLQEDRPERVLPRKDPLKESPPKNNLHREAMLREDVSEHLAREDLVHEDVLQDVPQELRNVKAPEKMISAEVSLRENQRKDELLRKDLPKDTPEDHIPKDGLLTNDISKVDLPQEDEYLKAVPQDVPQELTQKNPLKGDPIQVHDSEHARDMIAPEDSKEVTPPHDTRAETLEPSTVVESIESDNDDTTKLSGSTNDDSLANPTKQSRMDTDIKEQSSSLGGAAISQEEPNQDEESRPPAELEPVPEVVIPTQDGAPSASMPQDLEADGKTMTKREKKNARKKRKQALLKANLVEESVGVSADSTLADAPDSSEPTKLDVSSADTSEKAASIPSTQDETPSLEEPSRKFNDKRDASAKALPDEQLRESTSSKKENEEKHARVEAFESEFQSRDTLELATKPVKVVKERETRTTELLEDKTSVQETENEDVASQDTKDSRRDSTQASDSIQETIPRTKLDETIGSDIQPGFIETPTNLIAEYARRENTSEDKEKAMPQPAGDRLIHDNLLKTDPTLGPDSPPPFQGEETVQLETPPNADDVMDTNLSKSKDKKKKRASQVSWEPGPEAEIGDNSEQQQSEQPLDEQPSTCEPTGTKTRGDAVDPFLEVHPSGKKSKSTNNRHNPVKWESEPNSRKPVEEPGPLPFTEQEQHSDLLLDHQSRAEDTETSLKNSIDFDDTSLETASSEKPKQKETSQSEGDSEPTTGILESATAPQLIESTVTDRSLVVPGTQSAEATETFPEEARVTEDSSTDVMSMKTEEDNRKAKEQIDTAQHPEKHPVPGNDTTTQTELGTADKPMPSDYMTGMLEKPDQPFEKNMTSNRPHGTITEEIDSLADKAKNPEESSQRHTPALDQPDSQCTGRKPQFGSEDKHLNRNQLKYGEQKNEEVPGLESGTIPGVNPVNVDDHLATSDKDSQNPSLAKVHETKASEGFPASKTDGKEKRRIDGIDDESTEMVAIVAQKDEIARIEEQSGVSAMKGQEGCEDLDKKKPKEDGTFDSSALQEISESKMLQASRLNANSGDTQIGSSSGVDKQYEAARAEFELGPREETSHPALRDTGAHMDSSSGRSEMIPDITQPSDVETPIPQTKERNAAGMEDARDDFAASEEASIYRKLLHVDAPERPEEPSLISSLPPPRSPSALGYGRASPGSLAPVKEETREDLEKELQFDLGKSHIGGEQDGDNMTVGDSPNIQRRSFEPGGDADRHDSGTHIHGPTEAIPAHCEQEAASPESCTQTVPSTTLDESSSNSRTAPSEERSRSMLRSPPQGRDSDKGASLEKAAEDELLKQVTTPLKSRAVKSLDARSPNDEGAAPYSPHTPQRSVSDNIVGDVNSETRARMDNSAQRSGSVTSISRFRTPESQQFRPDSPSGASVHSAHSAHSVHSVHSAHSMPSFRSFRSSANNTPPLRRRDRRISSDLRSLSHNSPSSASPQGSTVKDTDKDDDLNIIRRGAASEGVLDRFEIPSDCRASDSLNNTAPIANEGRVRSKDMTDVYDGYGEGRIGSPRSPSRAPSVRRRQSMQVLELEAKVEKLIAENRALADARVQAELSLNQRNTSAITDRDAEIESLKASLQWLRNEVNRLTEVNEGLQSANSVLALQHDEKYTQLKSKHSTVTRELKEHRDAKDQYTQSLHEKDAEIQELRSQLEATKEQIREMQKQILATNPPDADFLRFRDEEYFGHRCQQLCSHVQQWVLRFSKFSDMRTCRPTKEIGDEKIVKKLDKMILDGSSVDDYLSDRVARRDIFMSMTMNMIWDFVFTRYLFGMDREQRQKLKSLEKLLTEVGPPHAVRQWRAITLTLLSRRPAFGDQRNQDTEAVVQAILHTLSMILPPPSDMEIKIESQLRRVIRDAVDLSVEMRTHRAEYLMFPPHQPQFDANGELRETVPFKAAHMHERSSDPSTTNEAYEAQGAIVRFILFPLVVKKGDDNGVGDQELIVYPAQVLVAKPRRSIARLMTPSSDAGGAPPSRGATPSVLSMNLSDAPLTPPGHF